MSENLTHAPGSPTSNDLPEGAPAAPPTSQDVARRAKVSRATVSYVLNQAPNARISQATRERVLQAAAELGYVPHEIAASLRSGHRDLVLLPFFDWPYNQSSITYLQELASQLDQLGYTVMLRYFGRDDRDARARKIASFHPVGVVILAEELSQDEIDILSRNGVRAILAYGSTTAASIPSVTLDFTIVGELAGQHLVERGHRHLAVILPRDERIAQLGQQRLEGVRRATRGSDIQVDCIEMDFNPGEAVRVAQSWKHGPRPSGVFTYNDEYAMLIMSALQDVGLRIPEDVALVGCDDLPLCELLRPRLTSINLAPVLSARGVVEYFDRIIQGGPAGSGKEPSLPCRIVVRESS